MDFFKCAHGLLDFAASTPGTPQLLPPPKMAPKESHVKTCGANTPPSHNEVGHTINHSTACA